MFYHISTILEVLHILALEYFNKFPLVLTNQYFLKRTWAGLKANSLVDHSGKDLQDTI